jgi:hypothetical protein
MDAAFNQEVFEYVLKILANHELIEGKSIGVKSTTLEPNALSSIVRRDNWQSYQDFLTDLAKLSWPSRSRRRRVKTSQNATENARTRGPTSYDLLESWANYPAGGWCERTQNHDNRP